MHERHNDVDRQKKIVEILKMLHNGEPLKQAQQLFNEAFAGVALDEITVAERALIVNGLTPLEIQNLCQGYAVAFQATKPTLTLENKSGQIAQALVQKQLETTTQGQRNIPLEVQGTQMMQAAYNNQSAMPAFVKTMLTNNPAVVAADVAKIKQQQAVQPHIELGADQQATVVLPTGAMQLTELTAILQVLPLDLTFVDQADIVRWFSDNNHRIFPRTTAVLGRSVVDCHPPKSVPKVAKILTDFHQGNATQADFWINFQGKFIYIRYFAVRDQNNHYLGCLEVSQDLTEIRQLTGEKRL